MIPLINNVLPPSSNLYLNGTDMAEVVHNSANRRFQACIAPVS